MLFDKKWSKKKKEIFTIIWSVTNMQEVQVL